jgi:hypothetical protein
VIRRLLNRVRRLVARMVIGKFLRRFPGAMNRWDARWDLPSEKEVQSVVWALLFPCFPHLVAEEPLPRHGHSSYRADLALPKLRTLIEIKYARAASDFKRIEKEIMEDSVAYLIGPTRYDALVVFIYDASSSVQHHEVTALALGRIPGVADVIIVGRPSQLPPP